MCVKGDGKNIYVGVKVKIRIIYFLLKRCVIYWDYLVCVDCGYVVWKVKIVILYL